MSDLKILVKQIGSKFLDGTGYKLGMFGSRIVGRPAKFSDIDVAVMGESKIPGNILENLREAFENSNLPYRVDVVDLNSSSLQFKTQVLKEVVWL